MPVPGIGGGPSETPDTTPRPDEEPNDVTEQHETPNGVSGRALNSLSGKSVNKDIPQATVTRLATYLRVLAVLADEGVLIVSSEELAVAAGVGSAKLRKDLSFLGPNGVRGVGYDVAKLRNRIEDVLGLADGHRVILVGAGNLGRALAGYGGFSRRGFTMVGIFDNDPAVIGASVAGLRVLDTARLRAAVAELAPTIAVVTVPDAAAQAVCDELVAAGVQCILSFSPVNLAVPATVEVRRVDLAVELQMLSFERARSAELGAAESAATERVAGGETVHAVSTPIGRRMAGRTAHQPTPRKTASHSATEPTSKGSVVAP
ncbi:redox-sensing transcriptional repressor Rex [Nocardia nova]|nr:redox-sensing transcriptional repressor Rex [Nocardia nova]